MIVGYLSSDGKIYDRSGKFVKEFKQDEDEKEIKRFVSTSLVVSFWGRSGRSNPLADMYPGEGLFIQTNKRLIFIRELKPSKSFAVNSFFGSAMVEAMRMRDLKRLGLREYFEVYFDEIIGHIIHKDGYTLLILTRDNEIRSIFVSKELNSPEILKKEISRKEAKKMQKEIKKRKKIYFGRVIWE